MNAGGGKNLGVLPGDVQRFYAGRKTGSQGNNPGNARRFCATDNIFPVFIKLLEMQVRMGIDKISHH